MFLLSKEIEVVDPFVLLKGSYRQSERLTMVTIDLYLIEFPTILIKTIAK